jgi:hypothetical protein
MSPSDPAQQASPPPTAGAQAGRAPDFFIAGHPKCGTTALYLALRRHPQIYMPDVKEPQFFSPELRAEAQRRRARAIPQTLEAYLALFADAAPQQRAGEASPSYLRSPTAATEIAQLNPQARVIAVFREPASFLRSLHLQFVQSLIEFERDLAKALELEDARRRGQQLPGRSQWQETLMYSEHVRYVQQLRRYTDAFGSERVLALVYDDFRADNEATVRRVQRFLDVDDSLPVHTIEANPSVGIRSGPLHRAMRATHLAQGPAARAAKSAANTIVPRDLRRKAFRPLRRRVRRNVLYGAPQAADEQLMRQLRARFADEVVALGEFLDRDLVSLWGYDQSE